jgi:hypothetical protein
MQTLELNNGPLFPLGKIVWTRGVNGAIADGLFDPMELIFRHGSGDWGDLDDHDHNVNDEAVKNGERILSAYETKAGKVWIITEWDRSVTTILFPSEY